MRKKKEPRIDANSAALLVGINFGRFNFLDFDSFGHRWLWFLWWLFDKEVSPTADTPWSAFIPDFSYIDSAEWLFRPLVRLFVHWKHLTCDHQPGVLSETRLPNGISQLGLGKGRPREPSLYHFMINANKCVFNKRTIKDCVSCTSTPSTPYTWQFHCFSLVPEAMYELT